MSTLKRLGLGLAILLIISGLVLGLDALRARSLVEAGSGQVTLLPGSIPIYLNGRMLVAFSPADLESLKMASFVEPAEGKTEEGWLLYDVIRLYLLEDFLDARVKVKIISSSRDKSMELTWAEIADQSNMVMFDLSGRGTLKLVSKMAGLDDRDEWVQDVDRIEVNTP
jgi:hypothetical protein